MPRLYTYRSAHAWSGGRRLRFTCRLPFGHGLLDIRNSSRRLARGLSMIDFHFADAFGGFQGFLGQGTPVNADADQRAVHGVSRAIRGLVNLLLDRCKELPAKIGRASCRERG